MLEDKWALVVENDAHTLVAISSILRDLGIRFKRNTTGENVVEQIRAMNPRPDFILLDTDLPHAEAFVINRHVQSDSDVARHSGDCRLFSNRFRAEKTPPI